MDVHCHCGQVHFKTPTDKPLQLWRCHCTNCQKQSSSAFGMSALFDYFEPPANDSMGKWNWNGSSGNPVVAYFCKNCGTRVIHQSFLADGSPWPTTSVKGGALDLRHQLDWGSSPQAWTRSAIIPVAKSGIVFTEEAKDCVLEKSPVDTASPGDASASA